MNTENRSVTKNKPATDVKESGTQPPRQETRPPQEHEHRDPDKKTMSEVIDDSLHSRDQPLGKQSPGSPFALVAWSYLLILFLFLGLALGFFYFYTR